MITLNQSMRIFFFFRTKLCYTDTDSFIINIINEYFLKIFLMMLENGLTRLIIIRKIKYLFQKEKIKTYQVFLKMN